MFNQWQSHDGQMHDITGGYNRFDIFSLRVNGQPLSPIADEPFPASFLEVGQP